MSCVGVSVSVCLCACVPVRVSVCVSAEHHRSHEARRAPKHRRPHEPATQRPWHQVYLAEVHHRPYEARRAEEHRRHSVIISLVATNFILVWSVMHSTR